MGMNTAGDNPRRWRRRRLLALPASLTNLNRLHHSEAGLTIISIYKESAQRRYGCVRQYSAGHRPRLATNDLVAACGTICCNWPAILVPIRPDRKEPRAVFFKNGDPRLSTAPQTRNQCGNLATQQILERTPPSNYRGLKRSAIQDDPYDRLFLFVGLLDFVGMTPNCHNYRTDPLTITHRS